MENDIASLHQKVDMLSEQVSLLTEFVQVQQSRQQAMDELKDDMIPIANQLIKISIDELAEVGTDFKAEDILFLLKRVLRNTHLILDMFDKVEALMGITDEVDILGKQVFNYTAERLDELERAGYFSFAREGWVILDNIISEFSEEDVRALGENIVVILTTIRNMTQPEILALANNAIGEFQKEPMVTQPISTMQLLKELRDPQVRIGMARLLNLIKILANTPVDKVK
ncbi:MAG: DUF1641 domain-containing protein [Aliifodinibius sp.]|nr:DUF1641 domain-containing protein [Fodinibius sp.]NIW40038.1 DUF1641 domain-containing protein [candidate division Zixibacteria bacterium]NIY25729.1 DUF1641 domain-containing protein [Fodinibius sp.]